MHQTREIANRLCSFINQYAKIKHVTAEEAAQNFFGVSAQLYREMKNGKVAPSLQTCEVAVKRGCHPRYLFLGDMDVPGDAVRCFSYRNGNKCRMFEYPECQGYDKCPFYKSEQMYLALLGGVKV